MLHRRKICAKGNLVALNTLRHKRDLNVESFSRIGPIFEYAIGNIHKIKYNIFL